MIPQLNDIIVESNFSKANYLIFTPIFPREMDINALISVRIKATNLYAFHTEP